MRGALSSYCAWIVFAIWQLASLPLSLAMIASAAVRSVGGSRSQRAGVAASRLGGAGNRFAAASAHGGAAARIGDPGRRVFGNRAIANVALQSQFPQARFQGGFSGSAWPWWRGGFVLGWLGPLFWPYAY